jgi:hypothetical protein
VPTEEMYGGDFSNWVTTAMCAVPIYDPTTQTRNADGSVTRAPFPNNRIPSVPCFRSDLGQSAIGLHRQWEADAEQRRPPGTLAYVRNNFFVASGSEVRPNTKLSFQGRPHILSDKHRVSGYYGYNRPRSSPARLAPPRCPASTPTTTTLCATSDVFRMSWDWTLSPTKLNHFYAGWQQLARKSRSTPSDRQKRESIGRTKSAWATSQAAARTLSIWISATSRGGAAAPTTAAEKHNL